mgnify:CR=1 FL=1
MVTEIQTKPKNPARKVVEQNLTIANVPAKSIKLLRDAAERYDLTKIGQMDSMEQTFMMAEGLQTMRDLITEEMMHPVLGLMNHRLGFLTDKDPSRNRKCDSVYHVGVVRDVFIEAMLLGLRMVGNEVNIIASNLYATTNAFRRLLREYPGLKNLKLTPGIAEMKKTGAMVPFVGTWILDGVPNSLDRSFGVKIDAYTGYDAVIGKATRKMRAAVYETITGSAWVTDGEVDDSQVVVIDADSDKSGSESESQADRIAREEQEK